MQNCLLEVPSISVHKCPCADTQGACVESVHTRSYEEGRHPVPGGAGRDAVQFLRIGKIMPMPEK